MPRPNRYHPYSRTQLAAPGLSPRFPPPPTLRTPHAMPSIAETASAPPFQSVNPAYIRGTTVDGKPLVAKQIFRSADGTFHLQMQIIQFPSEVARVTPPPLPTPGATPAPLGPALMALGAKSEARADSWFGASSVSSSASSLDGGSERGAGECAILTDAEDDDDAEGEVVRPVEDGAHARAIVEQRQIMMEVLNQRKAMRNMAC